MNAHALIAIADDDAVQSELVASWLRALGFQVLAFPDGETLMAWAVGIASERPAAVLLDVEMPGRDGFEVCRSLRALPRFQGVRVACVSSIGADALARGARDAGADTALRKDALLLPRLAEWLIAA